ncbi:hypothetical protein JRO89_XSUnG0259600 [Xanthoceras sorbifolium]|uniref:BED-type domain-containing protein n=1 Tax=Xanthoceras sorbifolium TaxID=99658 RepID=A0ABQ8GWL2_9ROSI|nr:hypothetical protein JRO89_XSUnG0259600 [Xanthoceras sorbifolium]
MSSPTGTFTPAIPSVFSDDNPDQRQESSHIRQQNVDNQMMGLDLGKSSNIKQRKSRSEVWNFFEKYKDEDGKDWARCNLCNKDFDGSSRKGTTHLRNHYKSCQRNKRGGGGDKSAEAAIAIKEKAVMDQQLSHLDTTSGDKPAEAAIAIKEKAVMNQQLSHLDTTRMIIISGGSLNASDIMDVYNQDKEKLRKYFEKPRCRFSLTVDRVGILTGYIVLGVCFIDDDWKLKKEIISFERIEDDQNSGKLLKNVLLEWGIENNISFMINLTYDDKYVISSNEIEHWFNGQVLRVDPIDDICVKCIHVLDGIKWYLYNRMSKILNYITEISSKNGNFSIAIERAKSLGKEVTAEVIPSKQDLKLNWEQWCNSTGVLKIALGLKEAFFVLENMDPDFKSINLTKEQWDQVRAIYECYEDLIDTAFLDHWRNGQTANMYFPMICSLYTKSLLMAKHKVWFKELGYYSFEFESKVDKYWCEYKSILAVAAVLDPRFKMDIVQHWYKNIYGGECEAQLTIFTDYFINVYNEYAKGTNNFKSCTSGSQQTNSSILYEMLDLSGKLCKSSHDYDNVQSLNSELHLYLNKVRFPLIKNFNILGWWRDNTQYFPTLAKMACDFLSIQLSLRSHKVRADFKQFHIDRHSVELEGLDFDMVAKAYICTKNWLSAEYE